MSDALTAPRRLASLAATRLLDTGKDEAFDRLTRLASTILGAPIAAMTLVDAERQFIKSGVGLAGVRETPIAESFCQHAVRSREPFVVEDAREHPLVKHTVRAGGVVAYAGVPIGVDDGQTLGAFCVADQKPRAWSERDLAILKDLAAAVESQIAAHRSALESEARRQLLETVLHTMGSGLMVMGPDRRLTLVNAPAERMLDPKALESPIDERPAKVGLYRADGRAHLLPEQLPLARAARGEIVDDFDIVIRRPDRPGTEMSVSVSARPLPAGGAVMVLHDMTERRELERKARFNETLYHKVASNIPNALVYLVDKSFKVLLAEGRAFERLDMSAAAVQGKNLREVAQPASWPEIEAAFLTCFGGQSARLHALRNGRTFEAHCEPVYDGSEVVAAIAIYFDVTERERTAARLSELSVRDELTGLYNRRGFIERGQKLLDSATPGTPAPVLFFVDLNGMKPINDQMGHHEGDRALTDTARVLEKAFAGALVARLGGDEFVVLAGDLGDRTPTRLERDLKAALGKFNDGCTRLYRLSLSVGYTTFDPRAPRTIEQLLTAADAQMYAAKRARQDRGNISPPPRSR